MQFPILESIERQSETPDYPDNDVVFVALNKMFELCALQRPCPCKHKERCLYLQEMIAEASSKHTLNKNMLAFNYEKEIKIFMEKAKHN